MSFEIDNQTLKDLDIFSSEAVSKSVFSLFDNTKTIGGKKRLLNLLENPFDDQEKIELQRDAIKFFYENSFDLTFNKQQFDFIDYYLQLNVPILKNNVIDAAFQSFSYKIKPTNDYFLIQTGIKQLLWLLTHLNEKVREIKNTNSSDSIKFQISYITNFLDYPKIKRLLTEKKKLKNIHLNRLDFLFRKRHKNELINILDILYTFEALDSISQTAKNKGFSFPQYISGEKPQILIKSLFHPFLKKAIPYDLIIGNDKNLCFLTGPNMAGKSTFLKSVGLSVYLAHLGFPVPAKEMKTTVFNGIISTINLSDDINKGYSHFYSEVKRVKETALKLKEKQHLLVIFDELFRGTNVKDAYDASLFVIRSFSQVVRCTFFISTHITEITQELKNSDSILFKYFDSKLTDNKPQYSFKLLDGVSHERLGMLIIKNENIPDILNSINNK